MRKIPATPDMRGNMALYERFFSHVNIGPECWTWVGSRNEHGYGNFCINGRSHRAHRISWAMTKGKVADGLMVCHMCDNPPCVNPAHLFLGTNRDNMADCIGKGRLRRPTAQEGNCRISDKTAIEIVRKNMSGSTQIELSSIYGVSYYTVHMLCRGKRRGYILEAARKERK